jgi:hypothetical protein
MTTTFWDMAQCNLIEEDDVSEVCATSIWAISLMMEAVRTSETSIYLYESTRRHTKKGVILILADMTT